MKRILKYVAVVVGLLVAGAAGLFASVFVGKAPIPDGMKTGGVEVVKDGYVSAYLVELGTGKVALVDSGGDTRAATIRAALARRGLGAEAVRAVLLTHGDSDHTAGARLFPQAEVMAMAADVELAEGRAVRSPFQSLRPTGFHVGRVLRDGDVVDIEGTRFEVFAMPGHTPGSAAFLAHGVLFLGDSAEVAKDGSLEVATWLFCASRPENRRSLQRLARRLESRAGIVKALACSHSGVLDRGLVPLTDLASRLAREVR